MVAVSPLRGFEIDMPLRRLKALHPDLSLFLEDWRGFRSCANIGPRCQQPEIHPICEARKTVEKQEVLQVA